MNTIQTGGRAFSGTSLRRCLSTTAVTAILAFCGVSSQATPILDGDVDLIVSISQPSDCPGCSAHELDVLQRGVGIMLTEMKNTAIGSEVCVAEASLAKDLAVLSFNAHRSGAVSENRWRDSVRYKGRFAGRLTQFTIDTMLLAYREALAERIDIDFSPGSSLGLQTDIYASGQLARIFDRLAVGDWQDTWHAALQADANGLHPVIDAILDLQWPGRSIYDQILIYSRVDAHWREAELARMASFQPDFLVGSIEADRDQLLADYRSAMIADPWTLLVSGCARQAAEGFRRHALALSQGIGFTAVPTKEGEGQVLHQDPGTTPMFEDTIDVVGALPPVIIYDYPTGVFSGIPPGGLVPRGGVGPIGNGPSGGGGGGPNGDDTSLGEDIIDTILGDTSPLRCEVSGGVIIYLFYSNSIAKIEKIVIGGVTYVLGGVSAFALDVLTTPFRFLEGEDRFADELDLPDYSVLPLTRSTLNAIERFLAHATSDLFDENCERTSP